MSIRNRLAGTTALASNFAHLVGLAPRAGKKSATPVAGKKAADEDDPERAQREDETDDEYAARMKKMDDDEAAAAADDPDDGDEDEDKAAQQIAAIQASAELAGRQAERARWAAVLGDKKAADRLPTACAMLADTDLSAEKIMKVLGTTAAPGALHAARQARNAVLGAGGEVAASSHDQIQASWGKAFAPTIKKRA